MKKLFTFLAAILSAAGFTAGAQVTATPLPLQEDSRNVVVYYHADQGNKALADLPASTQLYAHTGVLTSKSSGNSDWKYAPTWGDNSAKYALEYVSPNLYKLNIGDIRTYYGITDPAETVRKLAFVFRTANASSGQQGKTESGGDIFLDVLDAGLQVALETNLSGNLITAATSSVTLKLGSTEAADLTIKLNDVTIAQKSNTTLLETTYIFTEPGNYTLTGEAVKGTESATTSMQLLYARPSAQKDYPGGIPKQGTVRNADGSVTFCLAAPEKESVILAGSWNDYSESDEYTMDYQDYEGFRYFWINIDGLDETTMYPYYYLVDGKIRVGDPYAKLILDPYNDKYISSKVFPGLPAYPTSKVQNVMLGVYQENINDFEWTDDEFVRPDKDNIVVYELLLRDFTGTEGKKAGNGTVNLALEKIPYLKELGINVIELLPINEFNGNISWGYNPNFYFAPDKAYGTPDDYKTFINTCHENGIAVVLDMVFNQSDGLHPWYQLYAPGSNPFYNLDAPHAYSVLNDWNQGMPLVRKQWQDCVKYWIEEYHVDGYRFDLVKGLGNNDSYANSGDSGTNAYNSSRVANMRAIQQAMEEVTPDAYFINENLAGAKEENEMAAFGMLNWANVNEQGCQYAMGYSTNAYLNRFLATDDNRTWGSTVSYLESHDEQRLAYKQVTWGVQQVKDNHSLAMHRLGCAAAQMILMPGAHMIWQFSEMGNAENTKNNDGGNNTDPKKVDWSLLDEPANRALFDNYARMISFRLSNPELFTQEAQFKSKCTAWSAARTISSSADGKEFVCVINPQVGKELTANYNFASQNADDYVIVTKSSGSHPVIDYATGDITVPANCFVLIASNNISTVEEIDTAEESPLHVRGANGALVIENAPEGYEVYTINGAKVAQGSAARGEIALPAGIYIVRSGADALKTIVY